MAPSAVDVAPAPASAPVEVKKQLPAGLAHIPTSKIDTRSDEEIAEWLQHRHPVTSEKNVWAFWNSGWKSMKPWNQRTVINWVRRLGPEWTVHMLDHVPDSETSVTHFVEEEWLPEAFNKRAMNGPFVGQHSADLIRLPLLYKYGGVWMDASTILLRDLNDICWNKLEDPESPYQMAGFGIEVREDDYTLHNYFIASRAGNPFIKHWHSIFCSLWEGPRLNALGFHKNPLFKHLKGFEPPLKKMNCPTVPIPNEFVADYLAQWLAFERLRALVDPTDGFDGAEYYSKNILLMSCVQETYAFQIQTHWAGRKQFEILNVKRDGEGAEKNDAWYEADKFVNFALAEVSTIKLAHGPGGEGKNVSLADLWDKEEFHNADNEEGTFAAYLRYGSTHYDQTRAIEPLKLPKPEAISTAVLEPYEG